MFDKKVDVAQIMMEIKRSVVPEESINDSGNESFQQQKQKILAIHTFAHDLVEHSQPYLDIGYSIPEYGRFPAPVRKVFRFITKLIAKSTRFITNDQNLVNHDVQDVFKSLLESQTVLLGITERLEQDNHELRQRIDELAGANTSPDNME